MNSSKTFFYAFTILFFPSFLSAQLRQKNYLRINKSAIIQPVPSLSIFAAGALTRTRDFEENLFKLSPDYYEKILAGFEIENYANSYSNSGRRRHDSLGIHKNYVTFIRHVLNGIANEPKVSAADKEAKTIGWVLKFKETETYKRVYYFYNQKCSYVFEEENNFLNKVVDCTLSKAYDEDFLEKSALISKVFEENKPTAADVVESIILKLRSYPLFEKQSINQVTTWDLLSESANQSYFKKILLDALYKKNPELSKIFMNNFNEGIFYRIFEGCFITSSKDDTSYMINFLNTILDYNPNFNNQYTSATLQLLNKDFINMRTVYMIFYLLEKMQSVYSDEQITIIANHDEKNFKKVVKKRGLFVDNFLTSPPSAFDEDMLHEMQKTIKGPNGTLLSKDEIVTVLKKKCGYIPENKEYEGDIEV